MTVDASPKAAPRKAGQPIWPKVPAGFVRSVLAGHSALGLAFAALIYLVCFSGSVAVFAREFQRWEQADVPVLTQVTPAAVQAAMVEAVRRTGDGIEHVYITPPTEDLPRLGVVTDAHGKHRAFTADASGRLIDAREPVWTDFMTSLHIHLHLPQTWGMFVVGLTGVALLSSLISGVLAHPRVFKDAFHLRWGGSKRLQEADLHNRMGVWALPFHVIVSLTGALLGLTTIILSVLALALFQGDIAKAYALFLPPVVDDPRPAAALPDLVAALEATQRVSPGSTPTFIGLEHPTERGQAVVVNASQPGRLVAADSFYFDGQGRPLAGSKPTTETNLGQKILGSLGPLHFGWYGGIVLKLIYGLLGLALTAVTASGVAIWLARRRDKGRPAPRWERIWIATVWSQPLAFVASALTALTFNATSEALPLAAWGGVTLLALACAALAAPARLSSVMRLATAGLLVAAVLVHLVRHGAAYADPAAWWMNGALVAIALVLTASALRRKKTDGAPQPASVDSARLSDRRPPPYVGPMTTRIARLPSRALIRVGGPDAKPFLHNLLTQDVETISEGELRFGALLSPPGRLLFDLFIFGEPDGVLLDVAAERRDALIQRLSMYRLRAAVTVEADDRMVFAGWAGAVEGFAVDPREPALGGRRYGGDLETNASEDDWQAHRLAIGVPDPSADAPSDKTYPIEADFDLLNGIDFQKGCFIGQETTSRMKRRGAIRNRMLPLEFDGPPPPFGTEVLNGELRAGEVLSGRDGVAMALVRLDRLVGDLTVEGRPVRVRRPDWLPDPLPAAE